MVYIVGIGPGSRDYILPKAVDTMNECQAVLGFKRAVESLDFIRSKKIIVKSLSEIMEFIENNKGMDIALPASGDPCYYGLVDYIRRNYEGTMEVIPGISSFQYLAAKLLKPWQGSFLGSLHGRSQEFIERVKENRLSIWLTDRNSSPDKLCRELVEAAIKARVYVGENLSYEDERITEGSAEELGSMSFADLAVVIVENITERAEENDIHKG